MFLKALWFFFLFSSFNKFVTIWTKQIQFTQFKYTGNLCRIDFFGIKVHFSSSLTIAQQISKETFQFKIALFCILYGTAFFTF